MDADRRRSPDEDRISGLPDELLHSILLRLRSIRAAARTGVLSRRWRHVWARLPELVLFGRDGPPPSTFLDSVDAALAACSAPTLKRLDIFVPTACPRVPARRVAPWLRFASQRVSGALTVFVLPWTVSLRRPGADGEVEELELPACDGATKITLCLDLGRQWQLRLQPVGLFTALTELTIEICNMEATELTALASARCPRLKDLRILVTLVAVSDVSVCSESLVSLWFHVENTRRLEVLTPMLEVLDVSRTIEADICAPKLAKLIWQRGAYNPHKHQFTDVGRYLPLLDISSDSVKASLLQRFDKVGQLKLGVSIPQGISAYESFLNETNKLPKCETLLVSSIFNNHGLAPVIFHLLRSCNSIRKFAIRLVDSSCAHVRRSCPLSCPCRLPESCRIDNVALFSLEEIEISLFTSSQEDVELLEQLFRCNAPILKKLVINYTPLSVAPLIKEICDNIRSKCRPNLKVVFRSL